MVQKAVMVFHSILVIICISARTTFACDGWELVVNYARNCGQDDVIQLRGVNASLTEDCILKHYGCSVITRPITQMKVHYKAEIPPTALNREGDADACERAKTLDETQLARLRKYNLPTSCPLEPQEICGGKKEMDISKFKDKLGILAAPLSVHIDIDHGEAGTTCIEWQVQLKKKGFFGIGG